MIDPTSRRFASPVVAHRVLDGAFASVSIRTMSAHGKMRPARARRRGQALLIAVLLMVFAAVLGATFVTVVALNLNQTARSGSVNTARIAAIAGSNYVNDQLTNSPLGERWRPYDASSPASSGNFPLAGDPATADSTYYFTDFERAQGWDQADPQPEIPGDNYTRPRFVKFPDPRSTAITGNNTPIYLTKIEPVVAPLATDPDHERDGQLKVTVIGRASDNDAAYSPLVFYKPTSRNGNMTSFARYDSNWNFGTNSLLTTKVSGAVTASTVVTLASTRGLIPGRTFLIGTADLPAAMQARIVKRVGPDSASPFPLLAKQVEFDQPVTAANNDPVRAASPYVGGLPDIDAQGTETGMRQATATPSEYQDVLSAPKPSSGGIMINNGLFFEGKSQFTLNTTGARPDRVLVTGPISIKNNTTVANVTDGTTTEDIKTTSTLKDFVRYQQSEGTDPTDRTQVVHPLTPARLDSTNSRWLQMTKLADINNGSLYGYGPGVYIDNKEDFESVTETNPNTTNDAVVTTFRKMTISETQRLLTRKSLSATPNSTTNFTINHTLPSGVLKVETFDRVPGNTDLKPDTVTLTGYGNAAALAVPIANTVNPNTFNRLSFTRLGVDTYNFPIRDSYPNQPFDFIGSLEQRGVRGWVSPFEFLPRGALIELRGGSIVITRDDLSDAAEKIVDPVDTANMTGYVTNPKYNRPDENKAWKNTDGSPLPNPGARTYRMRIDIATGQRFLGAPGNEVLINTVGNQPFNGVIYADGNVRVRGHLDKDVTVVSMGNIYIEGGINQNGGHVALLAKRNVVLNPTEFAARPVGLQVRNLVPGAKIQNVPVGTPISSPASSIDVPVDEVSGFRVGDRVRIGTPELTLMITKISATSGVAGAGTISLANPADSVTGTSPTLNAADASTVSIVDDATLFPGATKMSYGVGSSNFSRDLLRDGATNSAAPYQLAIVHAGQLRPGIQMVRQTAVGDTVDIKKEVTIDGIIKTLDGEKQIAAAGSPTYDLTTAPTNTLQGLQNVFTSLTAPTPPDPDPNWDLTVFGGVRPATSAHRLASVSAINLVAGIPRNFLLTTSVGGFWQGSAAPNFVIGSGFLPTDDEELRTVQESFYGIYNPLAVGPVNPFTQAEFQGMNYQLPTAPDPTDTNSNTIALRRVVAPTETLANDLVAGIKYDRDTFANVVASPVNVNVQATIYAQDGSWFIIPMPSMTPNNAAPVNAQIDQAYRYRRLNYQITVKASIGENFAPTGLLDYDNEQTPDQSPTSTQVLGAQAQWLDSSSYPVDATGAKWQTINYLAPDPLPVTNNLYLPITPDIINQR